MLQYVANRQQIHLFHFVAVARKLFSLPINKAFSSIDYFFEPDAKNRGKRTFMNGHYLP